MGVEGEGDCADGFAVFELSVDGPGAVFGHADDELPLGFVGGGASESFDELHGVGGSVDGCFFVLGADGPVAACFF